jgi:hypothetical protein
MNCTACNDLYRTLQRTHSSYVEACNAAFFKVSTEIAAMKQIAMERAKSDLYEHQLDCASARLTDAPGRALSNKKVDPPSPSRGLATRRSITLLTV